jgi:hypothetical protein
MSEEVNEEGVEKDVFQNPKDFGQAIESIEVLHGALLFGDFAESVDFKALPQVEQYVLLALSSLAQAQSFLRLAHLAIPAKENES